MSEYTSDAGDSIVCPHCGHSSPPKDECVRCGIVFAKYRGEAPLAAPRSIRTPPQSPSGTTSRSLKPLLLLLILTALAGYAVTRLEQDEAGIEPAPPAEQRPSGSASVAATELGVSPVADPVSEDEETDWEEWSVEEEWQDDPVAFEETTPVTASYSWNEGSYGYQRAVEEARQERKPLVVYFQTDWCGYCRELERELLTRARVEDYLKYMAKVRVNPESGPAERVLANRYGVRSYPSLFVHAADLGPPTKVRRGKSVAGERRLQTPEEFVKTLRQAAE